MSKAAIVCCLFILHFYQRDQILFLKIHLHLFRGFFFAKTTYNSEENKCFVNINITVRAA